jgi:8-oxo-dGTP pyrophosphatase MutT (NUDIX family)
MSHSTTYTIYFGASALHISTKAEFADACIMHACAQEKNLRAKIIKKVEFSKSTTLVTDDPEATFAALCKEFKVVRAAGGVVTNCKDELLMIRLRNRWDLPKGHIEAGEDSRTAALREVEEETGIKTEALDNKPLATTWHAYNIYGPWELKSTDWWRMRATNDVTPAPQEEEGITEVRWMDRKACIEALTESYETIKEVVHALDSVRDTHND